MNKILRLLLLAAALLVSQHAALLHGLAHAEHDIAAVTHDDGEAPALDHDVDVCAAFGAVAHALGGEAAVQPATTAAGAAAAAEGFAVPALARLGFSSRAPPLSA